MHVVYGGAFNPPTKAHLDVYYFLHHKVTVEKFIYLPVGNVYGKDAMIEGKHRFAMLKRMVSGLSDVEISTIELDDETYKGTYESLRELKEDDTPMAFIIGADHLKSLNSWKHSDRLLKDFQCIVLNRDKEDLESLIEKDAYLREHKQNIHVFSDFKVDVSSSEFRDTLNENLVVPGVFNYILEHGLYGIKKEG
ncbi:MAG: nicotinate (nicotinamide) nucleotide adenylyltransferase [Bacillota bacterium]